jgi:hypothetical protein
VKITEITFSQAIRFFPVSGQSGGTLYGANLIHAVEHRYGFWESPKTVADYDINKGITFLHGFFEKRFVIDKFQIYANGILAEGKIPTEDLDIFVDDIIEWGRSTAGLTINDSYTRRGYNSHIEVFAEMPIDRAFTRFTTLGEHVTQLIRTYGINTNKFQVSGINLNSDNETLPTPKPIGLTLDRRAGKPYESQLFFSTASLKTADHLLILNEMEKLFMGMTSAS